MDFGPQFSWLADGKRAHFNHGPIDLIIEATGDQSEVRLAYCQAKAAFQDVLSDLVDELKSLRSLIGEDNWHPSGVVAKRMLRAASPYATEYQITPMIAVAGSVADYILDAMLANRSLSKAYVNNGGDIALQLDVGESFTVGVCNNYGIDEIGSVVTLIKSDNIGGVATSGWRGRSHSLGIADSVTVLANTAASADVAATLIANAIDLPGSTFVERQPATVLSPDSDLGERLVTVNVMRLSVKDVRSALATGKQVADQLVACGRIKSAYLNLQGETMVCVEDCGLSSTVRPRLINRIQPEIKYA